MSSKPDVWRFLATSTMVMPIQLGIVLCNFLGGVLLARGLAPFDRGAVAVASISFGLSTVLASGGLAELYLIYGRVIVLRGTQANLALLWMLVVSLSAGTLLIWQGISSVQGGALISLAIASAVANLHLISTLQLTLGIRAVSWGRLLHAMLATALLGLLMLMNAMSKTYIFAAWTLCEVGLTLFVGIRLLHRRAWSDAAEPIHHIGPACAKYTVAQLSGMFADRGLTLIAGLGSGLTGAGAMTVYQNVTAPITTPVQAFTTSILDGSSSGAGARKTSIYATLGLASGSAVAAAVLLPLIVDPLWGKDYAFIGNYSILVAASGFMLALWKTAQLVHRSAGRPSAAVLSDVCALGAAGVLVHFRGINSGIDICIVGLIFTGGGCITALSQVIWFRRRRVNSPLSNSEKVRIMSST